MLKNNKGVTLTVLVVTIIVIIILAGVTISSSDSLIKNTKVKNMKWRIFSIYKIPVTNDYLYANFADRNEYQTFLNTLKGRSIYDFGVEVNSNDHILTLSTCGTSVAQRMVIHAVLIKE